MGSKNEKKEYLSWEEYRLLSESYNVPNGSLISATKFLNDCGSLMYFGFPKDTKFHSSSKDGLSDLVILNLQVNYKKNIFFFTFLLLFFLKNCELVAVR